MYGLFSLGPCCLLSYNGRRAFLVKTLRQEELTELRDLRLFVAGGGDVKEEEDKRIIAASEAGYPEVVKYLVSQGADAKAENFYPFTNACYDGDLGLVKFLFPYIGKENTGDGFRYACSRGHLKIVKYLNEKGMSREETKECFFSACHNNKLEVLKYLLPHGIDIEANDSFSISTAAMEGHLKIVRFLVLLGAKIKQGLWYIALKAVVNGEAPRPLEELRAMEGNILEVLKYLEAQKAESTMSSLAKNMLQEEFNKIITQLANEKGLTQILNFLQLDFKARQENGRRFLRSLYLRDLIKKI